VSNIVQVLLFRKQFIQKEMEAIESLLEFYEKQEEKPNENN